LIAGLCGKDNLAADREAGGRMIAAKGK